MKITSLLLILGLLSSAASVVATNALPEANNLPEEDALPIEHSIERHSSEAVNDTAPDITTFDDINPKEWGIRHNCVSTHRIRNVNVMDSESAVLVMRSGKKILMRFKKSCRGIKQNGFIYSSRTGQLCARFDSIRVVGDGHTCILESFEPYVELEDNEPELEESSDNSAEK